MYDKNLDFDKFRPEVVEMRIVRILHGSHTEGFPKSGHTYGISRPSLLTESTDSMITMSCIISNRGKKLHIHVYIHTYIQALLSVLVSWRIECAPPHHN